MVPSSGSMAKALCIDPGKIVERLKAPVNKDAFLIKSLLFSMYYKNLKIILTDKLNGLLNIALHKIVTHSAILNRSKLS